VVRDGIALVPLAGAWVQLVAADSLTPFARTVVSDSLGRFTIADVPDGRYALGFFHPMLDSLGVQPPLRDVNVQRHRSVQVDLAIPSPAQFRAAICGPRSATTRGGLVVGVVRDARERAPSAGVTVMGDWLELTFRLGGIDRRRPRLVVTTGENGWFAMCNVPSGGTMFLFASRGADTTDLIDVQVPSTGFLRRDLYLGPARTIVTAGTADTALRADTLSRLPRRLRLGDGRLRGTVVTADSSRPLAGALVRIADGPMSRVNERGEWTLVNAPVGTRMLEVRAVGYYPARRAVDVVLGAAPVTVALSTFKAVLDTVRVTASRLVDRNYSGFEDRRRSGAGLYLTAKDLMRRGAVEISDVFRNLPGIREEDDSTGSRVITMRGSFGGYCSPAFYVNGLPMFTLSAFEIDNMVRVKDVRAIEVYTDATVPPQFQVALSGCGAILIWKN
jgi:TonB-dependent Receptor Plug Domain/Carboxypeptidase regulatory-like domain